jgi:hypothetical protein
METIKKIVNAVKEYYYNHPAAVIFVAGILTGLFLAFIF